MFLSQLLSVPRLGHALLFMHGTRACVPWHRLLVTPAWLWDMALLIPDSPFQPRPGVLETLPNGAEEQQYPCPTVLLEEAPGDEEGNHSSHDNQGKGSLEVEPTGRNEVAQVGWRRHIGGQKHRGHRITDS